MRAKISLLVRWCFEPSHEAKTNFSLSPIYFAHRSSNHKLRKHKWSKETNQQTTAHMTNQQTTAHMTNPQTTAHMTNYWTTAHITTQQTTAYMTNQYATAHMKNQQITAHMTNQRKTAHMTNQQTTAHMTNQQTTVHLTITEVSRVRTAQQQNIRVRMYKATVCWTNSDNWCSNKSSRDWGSDQEDVEIYHVCQLGLRPRGRFSSSLPVSSDFPFVLWSLLNLN